MSAFNEALGIAREWNDEYDYCIEYENAFVFSKRDERSFGGFNSPVAVLKTDGSCASFVSVIGELGDEVREGYIEEWV